MINVSELISDPDFRQRNGVEVIRRKTSIVDHIPDVEEEKLNFIGIITIADEIKLEENDWAGTNTESIHVFTYEKLKTTGFTDSADEDGYLSDIVVWNGCKYKVIEVLNDVQYGFSRATAIRMYQEVS